MKKDGGMKLAVVLVLLIVAVILSIKPIKEHTKLGLDLQGGAHVVLQAIPDEGQAITSDDMDKLASIMRKRVDEFGVTEPTIQKEGSDRLIIELAGVADPDKAIALLGKTAKLEFVGPDGVVILTGSELKNAAAQYDQSGKPEVALEFSDEGSKKFGKATARFVGEPISIYLDGKLIEKATVENAILSGKAVISGGFNTVDEALETAALLRGGALPVNMEIMGKRTVGPVLGQESLQKSFYAAMVGMVLLCIFMIAYYRLPGVIALVSLVVYSLILIWVIIAIKATLTLPGIAGFILSIGMAVDANIIIYERIKEELRAGKSLMAGIESGFKRAFIAVFDSNTTTILAAVVLFYLGTGSVQGFAIILAIGNLASMFTAVVFTRTLLRWTASIPSFNNKWLYGGLSGKEK